MRLREYLEIQNGLKSNLKEAKQNDKDLVYLMKNHQNKSAHYIDSILAAGYRCEDSDGIVEEYQPGEAVIYDIGEDCSDFVEDFLETECADTQFDEEVDTVSEWLFSDLLNDLVEHIGEFYKFNIPANDGTDYEVFVGYLPLSEFNYKNYGTHVMLVNYDHNTFEGGDEEAFRKLSSLVQDFIKNSGAETVTEAISLLFGIDVAVKAKYCERCDDEIPEGEELTTLYGETICEDCWDEYINSEEGLVEYVVSIARGEADITDFDSSILRQMSKSWKENKRSLTLTTAEIKKLEQSLAKQGFVL